MKIAFSVVLLIAIAFFLLPSEIIEAAGRPTNPTTWTAQIHSGNFRMKYVSAPATSNSLAEFDFGGNTWKTFLTKQSSALTQGVTLTATFEIDSTGNQPLYYCGWNTFNTTGLPANARFYFTTVDAPYDVNQGTVSPENYWWSVPGVFIASQSRVAINNTLLTVTTTLQPDQWSHALGTNGSVIQDKFLLALSQIKQVGLAFGGGSFYDVGVNQYYATFKLKSFSIQ